MVSWYLISRLGLLRMMWFRLFAGLPGKSLLDTWALWTLWLRGCCRC